MRKELQTEWGYVMVYAPEHPRANKRGYTHRSWLVVEKNIGRFLNPCEVVHHIDGDTSNDNPENLQLFESNSAHMSFHRLHDGIPYGWIIEPTTKKCVGCGKEFITTKNFRKFCTEKCGMDYRNKFPSHILLTKKWQAEHRERHLDIKRRYYHRHKKLKGME